MEIRVEEGAWNNDKIPIFEVRDRRLWITLPKQKFSNLCITREWFNYEVDSDEEWEEEEPGESLHGSDDEKDEENPEDNEYDVDNDFMVPHGYLSDEELRADEEDKEDMTPETQKFKLKLLGEQFESERNTKTSKLKPKIIGCIWRGPDNEFPSNIPRKTLDFLLAHEAWVRQIPIILPTTSENETTTANDCKSSTPQQSTTTSKKSRVPEEALPDLIRLVHGNTHSRRFLVKEFSAYWNKKNEANSLSKASLLYKIREIGKWMACPEEGPMHLKACWYVFEEIRKKYHIEELSLPNRWSYNLVPKRKSDVTQFVEKLEKLEKEDKDNKDKKNVPLITQFTKKITQEEMKKQLTGNPAQTTPRKQPKRATLISVNRGEEFPRTSKEKLKSVVSSKKVRNKKSNQNDSSDNVIVICSDDDDVNAQEKKEDKSENKKKNEDRLDATPMEFEEEARNEGEKSENEKSNESGKALKIEALTKNDVPKKNVKETDIDTDE
ncbi:Chromatin assembly factor 1 subunit A-A [Eufriesea mexicana]|uniref:Chromatin assembly factor 1 subunit A-A n=1 Tax=Eufriesea mexicana TaxID=516756 RepID=A0A310SQY2_9HYME|nr:Chromatin assembly factor 1 subunit A-A [Eufriesea mexicana]